MSLHCPDQTETEIEVLNETGSKVPPMVDRFKFDENEEEMLVGVCDHYRTKKDQDFKVRPWIDGDNASKLSMSFITQFALFKCMHENCIFSTNNENDWIQHIDDHIKFIDVLAKRYGLTNDDLRNHQIRFRECAYCPAKKESNDGITWHIAEEHDRSIFQCAYCFYRTIEIDCIALHCDVFHAKDSQIILMTGFKREFEDKDSDSLNEGEQYFKDIQCGE